MNEVEYLPVAQIVPKSKITSPAYIADNSNNEFTINYDISEIRRLDVTNFTRHQLEGNLRIINENKIYVLLRLILIEYCNFYKIHKFAIRDRRRFTTFMNNEIDKDNQIMRGKVTAYGGFTQIVHGAKDSNPIFIKPISAGGKSKNE